MLLSEEPCVSLRVSKLKASSRHLWVSAEALMYREQEYFLKPKLWGILLQEVVPVYKTNRNFIIIYYLILYIIMVFFLTFSHMYMMYFDRLHFLYSFPPILLQLMPFLFQILLLSDFMSSVYGSMIFIKIVHRNMGNGLFKGAWVPYRCLYL